MSSDAKPLTISLSMEVVMVVAIAMNVIEHSIMDVDVVAGPNHTVCSCSLTVICFRDERSFHTRDERLRKTEKLPRDVVLEREN